jgi:ATP-dependent protease HslVU (ClpYQ) peptidase subunit
MGGDSALIRDWDKRQLAEPKVFRLGEMLIGCAGSPRTQQLIQYNLEIPKNNYTEHGDMRYLVTEFIPVLRTCLKNGGETKIENNREETESILLLGWHGKAYSIQTNFQVDRISNGFTATGVGDAYAMGALAAMTIINPEQTVLLALEIAGMFSNGVCGPYYVFSI